MRNFLGAKIGWKTIISHNHFYIYYMRNMEYNWMSLYPFVTLNEEKGTLFPINTKQEKNVFEPKELSTNILAVL